MRHVFAAAVAALALFASPPSAHADTTLKVGTMAPPESPWGKVFKVWSRATSERTGGAVNIQFFWNAQQGDEAAMVAKIRTGQLDGAAITAVGLGQIYKQVLVLQLPGIFPSWAKLDEARAALRPTMDPEIEKQGFKVVGWGDVGIGRFMSQGFDVRVPADVKHKAPFYESTDPIGPVFFSVLGDVTPKPMSAAEVLTALTAGTVNTLFAPAMAAEQLQWASRLDHINTLPIDYEIGAIVVSSNKMRSLPSDVQAAILDTGRIAGEALTATIRAADDQALERRKQRMTAYEPTAADVALWNKLFEDTRARLRGSVFTPAVFDEAIKHQ